MLQRSLGDHPRACGAHCCGVGGSSPRSGSSPRMRGSLFDGSKDIAINGIIPAHAGLTRTSMAVSCCVRDHPRACGAHIINKVNLATFLGSSPRMRGSLASEVLAYSALGIIPAHAGLTLVRHSRTAASRDHPRACGAHYFTFGFPQSFMGSSPRMRGSLGNLPFSGVDSGIIPAHAGLTRIQTAAAKLTRDHPRACGAHFP